MKLNKKETTLYVDVDEKYHFIVGEMLKSVVDICFASDIETVIDIINKTMGNLDTIILCVDEINHERIVNSMFDLGVEGIHLILVSRDLDAMHMYDLVAVYGASDYITKPFSKQGIFECYQGVKKNGIRPYKQRLLHDLNFFNDNICYLNDEFTLDPPIKEIKLEPLDQQIQSLLEIKRRLESFRPFKKSSRPNILFIDDEKTIIDVYQNFVEDKPFNSFFSQNLAGSRKVLMDKCIDIIILDLGLPDGHGVNLLKEIYDQDCTNSELPDVIVISSYYEKDTVVDVINAGAKIFINKPMTYKKFISVIYQLTFLRYMRKELNIKKLDLEKKYVI